MIFDEFYDSTNHDRKIKLVEYFIGSKMNLDSKPLSIIMKEYKNYSAMKDKLVYENKNYHLLPEYSKLSLITEAYHAYLVEIAPKRTKNRKNRKVEDGN